MPINWVVVFNRLFEIINGGVNTYYGGTKFLDTIREVNFNAPSYSNYIEQRKISGKSTSRKDYYYDLLMEQSESDRKQIINSILDSVGVFLPEKTSVIKNIINQANQIKGPQAEIPQSLWNAERLTSYLEDMD
ncbi:MAG: hypothetical protein D4R43_00855, partial [Sphingobacteriales bacterium]